MFASEANKEAFDSWLAQFSGNEPVDIGAAGFDLMRPPLFQRLKKGLGHRFRLHPADEVIAACRIARPRALSLIRAASDLVQTTAGAFVKSWRGGSRLNEIGCGADER